MTQLITRPVAGEKPHDKDVPLRPATGVLESFGGLLGLRESVASRAADYLELTKPRIAVLALVTVTIGFVLGSAGAWDGAVLVSALIGIALVAAGSSALNQYAEIETDARMPRTADRPLPAGRLSGWEALAFGICCGASGCVWLAAAVNTTTAWLALLTLVLYAGVYTPLKKRTSLCTAIGAVPGALPPVLGWTAAGGSLDAGAGTLFAIMYLWQFPHFLAIAWLYRRQYAGAGLRMLPAADPAVGATGAMSAAYAVVLVPVSLLPVEFALAGTGYAAAAIVLGIGYALFALRFALNESTVNARRLLYGSLVYLPLLLGILTWNHLGLLRTAQTISVAPRPKDSIERNLEQLFALKLCRSIQASASLRLRGPDLSRFQGASRIRTKPFVSHVYHAVRQNRTNDWKKVATAETQRRGGRVPTARIRREASCFDGP